MKEMDSSMTVTCYHQFKLYSRWRYMTLSRARINQRKKKTLSRARINQRKKTLSRARINQRKKKRRKVSLRTSLVEHVVKWRKKRIIIR